MKISKKSIFFIVLIIIILLVLGVFFLWMDYEKKLPKGELVSQTNIVSEGYEEIEISGERFVKNEKYGLLVKVPENWTVKIILVGVDLYNPDVKFDENGNFTMDSVREGACGAGIEIKESVKLEDPDLITDAEYLVELMNAVESGFIEDRETIKNKIIVVDGKKALRTDYVRENGEKIVQIDIEVPIDQIVYRFSSGAIFADKCVDEFERLIEGTKINK